MNHSGTGIRSRVSILLVMVIVALCGTADITQGQVKLVSVKPTVFFRRLGDVLTQVGEATVSNLSQEQVNIALESQIRGRDRTRISLSLTVPKGETTVKFPLADIDKPETVTLVLKVEGRESDRRSMTWQPQRKWRVFFVPITHHDLGYTDTIENVLNKYAGFYDDILRFCRETDDWPDEAKYRYTAEGAWAMQHFIETRDAESIEELGKYVKQNRIEIGALMGYEISGLCSHE